jgi:hypothetical protein
MNNLNSKMLRPGSAIKRKIKPVPQAAAQKQQVNTYLSD